MAELGDGPFVINPVQTPPAGQLAQQFLTLRNATLQNQLSQQQLQDGQIGLQQKQQGLRDQQILQQMYANQATQPQAPANGGAQGQPTLAGSLTPPQQQGSAATQTPAGNIDLGDAARQGMSGGAIQDLRKQQLANAEAASVATKNNLEGAHFAAQSLKLKNDAVMDGMQGILALPPEQRPAAYQAKVQQLAQAGIFSPQEAQQHAQYPGDDILRGQYASLEKAKDQVDLAAKQADEARKAAQAPSQLAASQAEATIKGVTAQQMQANGMTNEQAGNLRARNASVAVERGGLALRQAEFAQNYGDPMQGLTGANLDIAKKLATGDFNPQMLRGMKGKEQILKGAIALSAADGVDWNPQIYATKKAFTDPESKQSQNLGTISRIVGHISRFEQNSNDAGFAPVYAWGGEKLGNLSGGDAALNNDAHAISAELEKLTSGGVGSEGQIKAWQAALHSPLRDARQQAIDEISHLIGSQYEGMQQTYKAGTGKDLPVNKFVSPDGQKWMAAKGINVGGATSGSSAGTPGGVTASGPAINDIQKYAGATYKFDGTQYVKQ